MSNTANQPRLQQFAPVLTALSLLLILGAFFFLPWISYPAFDTSFTAVDLLATEADNLAPREDAAAATIDYEWNRGDADGGVLTGSIMVEQFNTFVGGDVLLIFMLIVILAAFFLVYSVLARHRKFDVVSAISWIAIVGVYGLIFGFMLFVSHSNQTGTYQQTLVRQVLQENDAETQVGRSPTDILEEATEQMSFQGQGGVLGNFSSGFWVIMLGMVGLIAQVFIPRTFTRVVTSRSRGDGSSGMVTSDATLLQGTLLRQFVISVAIVFALFPVVFVASSAFNPTGQLSTQGLIPRGVETADDLVTNFRQLLVEELERFPYWRWLFNSFVVATVSTTLIVLITAMSAYAFSRFRFSGRRTMLVGILLIQVFPNLLAMVALFLILQQISKLPEIIPEVLPFLSGIDWSWLAFFGLDSLGGLILVYMGGAMGINTWLMKGFLDAIPRDIDESARVDGASNWQIFWMLIFPLIRPILAVVGVLAFVGTFNEFVLARVLLRDKENWTLMVGLFNFVNADFNRDWGMFAAGSLVAAIPVVMVYLALQDQIVGGLTAGSVKG